MIKPFKIIATRDDNGQGTGVVYSIEKIKRVDNKTIRETLEAYTCVPYSEDIDEHILKIIKESNFL